MRHGYEQDRRWHRNLLQGLGAARRDADRLPSWLAIVPLQGAALLGIKLLKHGTLKVYPGLFVKG